MTPIEAIVLAGGLGTRLATRLEGVPKSMAPVAGRPFLEILLRQLKRAGYTSIYLSVGYLRDAIIDHFGKSFQGMQIEYVIETAPLGTGGAIRLALQSSKEDAILVLNGDTLLDADYADMMRFHATEARPVTIAVVHQPDITRYGGVAIEGKRIVAFEEKGHSGPGWISAGAYVMNRKIEWPDRLDERFSIENDYFVPEVGNLAPAAYKVNGQFIDIGIPEDLDRAQGELAGFHYFRPTARRYRP
jgi:D-glycero-alpha-D-manno-heptose 1-phosphate guanylyltransferase